jgi:hypothetical protein
MRQRVDSRNGDIGIGRKIGLHVEIGAGIAAFAPARGAIVVERIDASCEWREVA